MGWTDFLLRLRALKSRPAAERDLDEELQFHLAMEARKKRLGGISEAEAKRRARVEFGGVEQVRESCRDIRGLSFLENLARDLRYGVRVLRKSPVFTTVATLSLAIGIGANTAIFSLVDTVLLRMLPVRSPEQLVVLKWSAKRPLTSVNQTMSFGDGVGRFRTNVFSWPVFSDLRARNQSLTDLLAFSPLPRITVSANGEARTTGGMLVSGNYFSALGVGMAAGRPILDDDDTAGGAPAAVISYRFWERVFSLDPAAVRQTIYLDRQPFTIVGITAREYFAVSAGGFLRMPEVDISVPIRQRERLGRNPLSRSIGSPAICSGSRRWAGSSLAWKDPPPRRNSAPFLTHPYLTSRRAIPRPEPRASNWLREARAWTFCAGISTIRS